MRGMILAAGLGTRFRPATFDLPKPLIPLCNEPLISYAIRNLVAHGISEIAINLHHLPDELREGVVQRHGRQADFEFSYEREILGTGGGIRRLRSWLEQEDDFVLLNGDTVQRPPLDRLIDARRREQASAALVLRRPPAGDRFTKVWFDDGHVSGFGEGTGEPLMFAGCHVLSREIFALLPDREFSGITEEVYIPLAKRNGKALAAIIDDGFWFDIGTPLRYRAASAAMRALIVNGDAPTPEGSKVRDESIIDESSEVRGSIERSVVGPQGVIAATARVSDSALWDAVNAGPSVQIDGSIIGRGVTLTQGAVVKNALVCRRLEVEYPEEIKLQDDFAFIAVDPSKPLVFLP